MGDGDFGSLRQQLARPRISGAERERGAKRAEAACAFDSKGSGNLSRKLKGPSHVVRRSACSITRFNPTHLPTGKRLSGTSPHAQPRHQPLESIRQE